MENSKNNKFRLIVSTISIILIIIILIFISSKYFDNSYKSKYYTDIGIEKNLLNIMYFNVGQADSTLITLNGVTVLIDSGNDSDGYYIADFLKEQKITKIDYLIGTHIDEDHIGGMDEIINKIEVAKLYIPKYNESDNKEYNEIKTSLINNKNKNLQISELNQDDEFDVDIAKCKVLSAKKDTSDINDTSIVLLLNYINTNYLFMGDASEKVEATISIENIDVLKAGHHGSNSSTSSNFLNKIKPQYAIISVESSNKYKNLPSKEVLERLKNIKAQIYRTDTNGTIWLTSDGNNINVNIIDINLNGANRKVSYSVKSILNRYVFIMSLLHDKNYHFVTEV